MEEEESKRLLRKHEDLKKAKIAKLYRERWNVRIKSSLGTFFTFLIHFRSYDG